MFEGIEEKRFLNMTKREKRWLDNIKKALHDNDLAFQSGNPEDKCLMELLNAIDTAKLLRSSLQGNEPSRRNNRKRFIEFLGLEIPAARPDASRVKLKNPRTGDVKNYTFGEIVYEIRNMLHENENLNAEEDVDYHILLDWKNRNPVYLAEIRKKQIICNGFLLWERLRQVLSKFITGIEGTIAAAENRAFSITCNPQLGSIRPVKRQNEKPMDPPAPD